MPSGLTRSRGGAALDSLPEDVEATGEVIAGGTDQLDAQRGIDLLVVGSRGYGR